MALVRIGIRVAEAVLGAGQLDEAVVGAGLVHLGLERGDLFRGDEAVGGAMLDQYLGLDAAGRGRRGGDQGAMEAHHGRQRQALAGHVQHHLATEAVADGGQPGRVGLRLRLEQVEAGLEACLGDGGVGQGGVHEGLGVVRVLGVAAVAVHVHGQGAVAEGGEVAGAALGVIVQAPPFMHHDHAGPRAADGVVPGVVTDQAGAVGGGVGDFTGLDSGLGHGGAAQQQGNQ